MSLSLDVVFDTIVNVHWGNPDIYRAIVLLEGQKGSEAYGEEFTPFYTEKQVNDPKKPIPVPVFGPFNPVATPSDSVNQAFSPKVFTGNALVSFPPLARIDYHGYTLINAFNTKRIGHNPFSVVITTVPPGPVTKFDFHGKKTGKIPVFSKAAQQRGLSLTGAPGVFMKLSSPNAGLTKYNGNKVVWTIPGVSTANYDPVSKLISAAFPGTARTKYYDLKGNLTHTAVIAGGIPEDISRKGNFYCFTSDTFTNFAGIQGYKPDGTLMWTVPGESIDTGYQFGSLVAFGEDYIVVCMTKNIGEIAHESFPLPGESSPIGDISTVATDYAYRVYDAKTGALVKEVFWGRDESTTGEIGFPGPPTVDLIINSKPAYAILHTAERSAYWP